jgi:beta-glucosidase
MAGDEVVQLYIRDEFASMPRPVKELKAFARIALAPGQARSVTFRLPVDQLAYYDEDFKLVVEAGDFQVMVGSSSADIRLVGSFKVVGEAKACVAQRVFICPVDIE